MTKEPRRYPHLPIDHVVNGFDPYSIEHLKAYKYCYDSGSWPRWFLQKYDLKVGGCSATTGFIETRIAEAWLDQHGI